MQELFSLSPWLGAVLEAFPWIGAAFGLWGTIQCGIEVNRGEVRPRLASWIAWGTSNAVFCVLAIMHGNFLSAGFNGIAAAGNFGILLLCAYRRVGLRPRGTTDFVCLVLTCLCLAVVVMAQGATYVAYVAMTANIVATWPTMKHAWQKPHEEPWRMFAANSGANALGLTGVLLSPNASMAVIAGPLISMLGNLSLVGITVGRTWIANFLTKEEQRVAEEVADMRAELDVELELIASATVPTPDQTEFDLAAAGK